MKRAYVDTSALVAVHFGEPEAARVARSLRSCEQLLSATLVVAELLSTLAREGRSLAEADRVLRRLSLFSPEGPLRAECEEALSAAPLRGADLWHVAAALALSPGTRACAQLSRCESSLIMSAQDEPHPIRSALPS
jgi:predicted nucleic acid-binding protein